MSHSKVINEIFEKLVDESFPTKEVNQYYDKFVDENCVYDMQSAYLGKYIRISEEDNLWYKLCVYYHAKTELFDRELTDLRSPYDPTEAYIDDIARKQSNRYALKIRNLVQEIGRFYLGYHNRTLNDFNRYNFSAQKWIDEYNRLVNSGEMDFMNKFLRYFSNQSNFTEEERLSKKKMLKENSKPIGINIFDL